MAVNWATVRPSWGESNGNENQQPNNNHDTA